MELFILFLGGAFFIGGITYATTVLFQSRRLNGEFQRTQASLESQIKSLEAEKMLLMDAQDSIMFVINERGEITLANKQACRFFKQKSLLGQTYQEVIKIPDVLSALSSGTSSPFKKEFSCLVHNEEFPQGEQRHFLLSIKPLEPERKMTRVLLTDLTEQYHAEQMRKDFLANASHELRTPLAIINGYVETLMDEQVLSDQDTVLRFLNIMKKHGERLTRIIEEMLLISKLESGSTSVLKPSPFSVLECVSDCLLHLDPIIKEKNVSIKIKMPDPALSLNADRFYWTQIFFNLIENAIKQNPHGNLKIKIGCAQNRQSGEIRIWVSDNGVGIPPEDLPNIFRRFYRVEKHHSQHKVKGTGLGLSIVKRAVEAHQGVIKCYSIQNKFTRFRITLPPDLKKCSASSP